MAPTWGQSLPPVFRVVSKGGASLGHRRSHRVFFDSSAARSSSATRASMSSISMALAPCVSTRSAARSFVDGWVCWSTMTLSTVETAALADCCNRAVPCPNASRRPFRKTLSNSGSCCHRYKVRGVILTARAACSTFVVVRSARIASCCFGLNSVTFHDILRHTRRVHREFFPMVDLFQKGLYFQALRRDSCDDHAARGKKDNDYDDFHYQRNERNSCVFEPRRGRRRNRNALRQLQQPEGTGGTGQSVAGGATGLDF